MTEEKERNDLRDQRVSVIAHTLLAVAVGAASSFIGNGLYGLFAAIVAVGVAGHVIQKAVGNRGVSWWAANGLIIYFFVWFDTWLFIANYL